MRSRYLRITVLFVVLLVLYLALAWLGLEPLGYYGSREEPRFTDPWLPRTRVILGEGILYRDVETTTPPLTNYLLVPPSLIAIWVGEVNPWVTLTFMVYFSLFNLFSAYALLALSPDEMRGYRSAVAFLLNPLTMGNAVLQRQDESILTFFFALALLCIMHHKTWRASVIMGLGLLIKITAGLVIIVSFLQEFRWRYLLIPGLVFAIVMAPFLLEAGEKAKFWDLGREHAEHPFQFGGVSLGSLYAKGHDAGQDLVLRVYSILLVVGVGAVLCVICWRPQGLLEDLALLLTMVLVLSPKSHPGYFSLLTLTLAPLLDRYQIHWRYYAVMALVVVASICKFPLDYYDIGLGIMVLAQGLLVWMTVSVRRESKTLSRRLAWRI